MAERKLSFDLMSLCIILATGAIYIKSSRIEGKLDSHVISQEAITKDVIGGREPEKFYNIGENRVYLEIDGRPVESYFPR